MSINRRGEIPAGIDLTTGLEESLQGWGWRFKVESVGADWLKKHNLVVVTANDQVECIDERPPAPFDSIPRASAKFPGASLGPAILEAVETRRPVADILHGKLGKGKSVFLHDDTHHDRGWRNDGKDSGCGANDHLPETIARFLTMTRGLTDEEAVNLAQQLAGSQTGGGRTRELVEAGAKIVATYSGDHTGRRLVVNTLQGKTLDHLESEGQRSFVVDAGSTQYSVQMALLAAATVDVLLPAGMKIEVAILR